MKALTSREPPEICRRAFLDTLSDAQQDVESSPAGLGLLLIDIDNLSQVNHLRGFSTGDAVLDSAHQALIGLSKLPDTVFRIGDHRFAFILRNLDNPAFSTLAVNKVYRVMEEQLADIAGGVAVELRIGAAIGRKDAADKLAILAQAEQSLASVGRSGCPPIIAFDGQGEIESGDINLEQAVVSAFSEGEFELHYQPKLNLESGRVQGVEALLRWSSDAAPGVTPDRLVSIAQSMGMGFELTKWVVDRAMRQLSQWSRFSDLSLSFNVPAELVTNPELATTVLDAVSIWGVDPSLVTVEITESGIMEDKQSGFSNLLRLQRHGIRLSIDDFGTGYSSLSYFRDIPANELKIDQSFVQSMLNDSQNLELIKIMLQIARQFELSVVAEGVEDAASLQRLAELGCDHAQGYQIARPMPACEFEHWLELHHHDAVLQRVSAL